MRVLVSEQLKRRIRSNPLGQGALAARVGLDQTRLSCFMHDRLAIGPVNRTRLAKLGALVGLAEADCFREVRR
jgi:hypothetical protein